MRKVISDIINSDPNMEVIGTANNGNECLIKIKQLNPDLVTLDIEMPVLDGLSALRRIMEVNPLPVIMVSSLTGSGAEQTINALNWGAVDFITKPSTHFLTSIDNIKSDLIRKIKMAAGTRKKLQKPYIIPRINDLHLESRNKTITTGRLLNKLILIGTSTGGPKALHQVLPGFPANLDAGILIVQHMPAGFTKSLADRLDSISRIKVKEAQQGEKILPGCAYVAPGDFHLTVSSTKNLKDKELIINLSQTEPLRGHRPSVDVMLDSVAQEFWAQMVCVIMTGMGQDGSKGLINIKNKGGKIIAEDQSTCIVYGMPKAAAETGKVDKVVPLPQIANEAIKMFQVASK
jgi:two-component system chemotaxis response regulator CheB